MERGCFNCKHKNDVSRIFRCAECADGRYYLWTPQTNADKYFRNATDEEIAEWLNLLLWGANTDVPYASFCTVEKWLDWLKQEVKTDDQR